MPSAKKLSNIFVIMFAVFTMAWLFALSSVAGAIVDLPHEKPAFQSTFLQLWDVHNSWSDEKWDELCTSLSEMGIQQIILQWSLITERPFFWRLTDTRRELVPGDKVEPAPAVERVVRAAERAGLRVRFGLTYDPNWWEEISSTPGLVEVYLNRLRQDQIALAATLAERYGKHPVFVGFYIPQELDDKPWLGPAKFDILAEHLLRLNQFLENLLPRQNVAISCFFNGYDNPEHVSVFWNQLLSKAQLDEVFVQDGVGAGKLTLDESFLYLKAVAKGAAQAGAHAKAIVEIFAPIQDRTEKPRERPGNRSGEKESDHENLHPGFEPASIERIKLQLAAADAAMGPDIIAFSLATYATSQVGKKGKALAESYKMYLHEESK